MTIDERIEALTQSVELLASLHKDNEALMTRNFNQIADALNRLTNIAVDHEHRLNDLGGGQS